MIDLSIIIASLDDCTQNINCINSYDSLGLSYEIVLCSDITPRGLDNVKYVKDPKTSVKAFNHSYLESNGEFILTFPGGCIPQPNMFGMVHYLDSLKYKVSAFSDDGGNPCFVPKWSASMYNIGKRPHILRFPAFHRSFIDNYLDGVIFNESFIHHWVDNWLGIFCGSQFNSSECNQFKINTIPHNSITKYDDHDLQVFEKLLTIKQKYNQKVN